MSLMNYYYQLEKGNKKFRCPACQVNRKYKRYIAPNGDYAEFRYGRCDRQQKCGYHEVPNSPKKMSFSEYIQIPKRQIKYIERNEILKSLGNYPTRNQLFIYLCQIFEEELVEAAFKIYCIGSHNKYPMATVFWYINHKKQITRGKIMGYDEYGHRVKEPFSQISSVHKELGYQEFDQDKCLFGAHLVQKETNKTICIVESEKTALIASIFSPEYLWLATGSASQLNEKWFAGITSRNLILYPDRGQEANWTSKVSEIIKKTKCNIKVSMLAKHLTIAKSNDGDDIADLIIEQYKSQKKNTNKVLPLNLTKEKQVEATEENLSPKLNKIIKKNPNVIKLIEKFGLVEIKKEKD